jgi:PAS domain S-box-containing protein
MQPNFEALFEASPYPYLLIAPDLTLIGANPAFLRASGRSADQLLGRQLFDAFPADPNDPGATNVKEVRASIEIALRTRQPHTSALLRYAVARETAQGRVFDERYWSAVHSPAFDTQGNVAFIVQNAIDVTDLYRFDHGSQRFLLRHHLDAVPAANQSISPQVQEALARSLSLERQQLQALFNQAPGFIAVLTGPEHVFEMVNAAYYQLVGHRDLIGKPLLEALPEIAGQGFKELLDSTFQTGQPVVLRESKAMLQRQPDQPLSEIYVDLVYQPVFGLDGRVTGVFAQGHDVTPAHEALQTLSIKVQELEEARSQQTFQLQLADTLRALSAPCEIFAATCRLLGQQLWTAGVTIADYDLEGRTVRFHSGWHSVDAQPLSGTYPAASFGLEDVQSFDEGSVWVGDDLSLDPRTSGPQCWPTFDALDIRAGAVVPLTHSGALVACVFVYDARPRRWTETETLLIKDAAHRMWLAVERVRAEQALKQADLRKDQFLAMLAHELRNPLAPISSAAALLKIKELPPETVARTSEVISRQVKHMTGLVDDLLDVSRVSTGRVALARDEVDIKQVIADAVEQVRPLLEARRHHFTSHLVLGEARVVGDYKRLVQVVANLLNNAAKYTPEGGRIAATVQVDADRVCIVVEDNGLGISAELLPHLFALFSQAERTPDRSQGGLGIGLALVRSLVELHSGTVGAQSDGLGTGCTFTVKLPRLQGRGPLPAPALPAATPGAADPMLRVLIVDDNVDAANMLAMLLQAKGYLVEVEADPFRALARAQVQAFDAFLLDIGLPGIDGYELVRRLRASVPDGQHKRCIAVTGYGGQYDRATALEAGFDELVVKPAEAAQILQLLQQPRSPAI